VRIILDSGAIIASERNDATFAAILKAARKDRTPILVPATVVAETWRGASTHARTAHLLGSVDGFPELNEQTARRVGALLRIFDWRCLPSRYYADRRPVTAKVSSRPKSPVISVGFPAIE
jgi:hypothetical protein